MNDFVLQYPFSSRLIVLEKANKLELATAHAVNASPYMFDGKLLSPHIAATMLLLLPKLAMTRFHMPPNMLAQVLALADPVVTCGRDIIRLESFSACGSAYARMDVDCDACDGEFFGKGTTNVDFQQSLRDALTALSTKSQLGLGIGRNEVKLTVDSSDFIERTVQLPTRWVRGFAEVASYQANMALAHDVSKVSAIRFVHSLPASDNDKAEYYVVLRRGELSLTQQKQANPVKVAGLGRLKLLKPLAPYIDRLRIYGDQSSQASSWLIDAGPYMFEFIISASSYRGFSGEGQLLADLAHGHTERLLPAVRAALNWQTKIDTAEVARDCGSTIDVVKNCLSNLASMGLVGYDSASSGYFHRELPFKPGRSLSLNPRLRGAREIIEGSVIEVVDVNAEVVEAHIAGSGVTHITRLTQDGSTCTCVWFAKHQGQRGPCKHILSLKILMEKTNGS